MNPPTIISPLVSWLLVPLALTGSAWGWEPATYPVSSHGFSVDTRSRNDVISFWHGVYLASEGYWGRHGWTGNYTAGDPYDAGVGTTTDAFLLDTERRINFHRALAGVPATVRLNTASARLVIDPADPFQPAVGTLKRDAVRRAAYMVIRTYGPYENGSHKPPLGDPWAALSHNPVQAGCVAWTPAAWNANHCGNLAIGYYGPGAIDAYVADETGIGSTSDWNIHVGHRRWVLYPRSTDMASGDTPGTYDPAANRIFLPSNTLYVVPSASEQAVVTPRFTSYPAAGYFPAPLNSRFWSLTYPGADFSAATVAMTAAGGNPVATRIIARNGSFGEPALVWEITDAGAAAKAVTADTTFNVTVAGIGGSGIPATHSYAVTLINPDLITSDQCLFGPASPATTTTASYQFTPPGGAEAMQVNVFQAVTAAWSEGAEDNPAPRVTAATTGGYAFRSTCSFGDDPGFKPLVGSKSFRLALPVLYDPRLNGPPPAQSFELDRDLLPGTNARLNFKFQRGYMTAGTHLAIESSADGGITWSQLGSLIDGSESGVRDAAPYDVFRDLAPSSVPVRIRFRLFLTPNASAYSDDLFATYPSGVFFDSIGTTNCQWLDLKQANDLAATASGFSLNATTAGVVPANNLELRLRLRAKLGNRWMPYGPIKPVVFTSASVTAAPAISPAGGEHASGQPITITSEAAAIIHYRVNGGAEQTAASPFSGLTVPAPPATLAIVAYASKAGLSDSAITTATLSGSLFKSWTATYFPGNIDPAIIGAAADPDLDGQNNLLEFALGGNPQAAGSGPIIQPSTDHNSATPHLLLTIAVRAGAPEFTGSPSPSTTVDGVTYTILGGLTPAQTDAAVAVAPLATTYLPAAPQGYEYRTFKLADPGSAGRGFMRIKVSGSL